MILIHGFEWEETILGMRLRCITCDSPAKAISVSNNSWVTMAMTNAPKTASDSLKKRFTNWQADWSVSAQPLSKWQVCLHYCLGCKCKLAVRVVCERPYFFLPDPVHEEGLSHRDQNRIPDLSWDLREFYLLNCRAVQTVKNVQKCTELKRAIVLVHDWSPSIWVTLQVHLISDLGLDWTHMKPISSRSNHYKHITIV